MKAQHQQVKVDRSQTLTEFIKEYEIKLKPGERYDLTDIAVTSDNKLLLCNDNDPIVSMLTFLISLNSMSISLIADDMS
jgi:hypothetical protein